jgi:uncharacterized protein YjbJ (UPF0337 family)
VRETLGTVMTITVFALGPRVGHHYTLETRGAQMGLTDKVKGKLKEAVGDLTDDPSLHREGRRDERKGEAKDELDQAHRRVERKAEEVADLERKTA